jgi:hypothetical protein
MIDDIKNHRKYNIINRINMKKNMDEYKSTAKA